jgi:cardiolipin synthase
MIATRVAVRERQQDYIARSHAVTKGAVAAWPMSRRLWNNLIATLGPVL